MATIDNLTPFNTQKKAVEGSANFRENASYSWDWLIQHTSEVNQLINALNTKTNEIINEVNLYVQQNLENNPINKNTLGLDKVDNTKDTDKKVLSASKLTTARNFALAGAIVGNVNVDFSGNVSLNTSFDVTSITPNSYKLGGFTQTTAASANTIVARDSVADVTARLFRTNYENNQASETSGICFRNNAESDNYLRVMSPIHFKTYLTSIGVKITDTVPTNVASADKLTTARNIVISGAVTGSAAFDGSGNINIHTSVSSSLSVGTYVFAYHNVLADIPLGGTVAGSTLIPASFIQDALPSVGTAKTMYLAGQGTLSGTWRSCGGTNVQLPGNQKTKKASLWLRIA
ncbi:hypothetical protein [Aliarcobacter lanthieri]|uniref:hypothetical protein n=1 Tax=Aliarcobacter lanthieri TaxID=1355374 RepID=UPI00047D5CC9|nr:hypothetical protein [Aliarcobacter lanthieri]